MAHKGLIVSFKAKESITEGDVVTNEKWDLNDGKVGVALNSANTGEVVNIACYCSFVSDEMLTAGVNKFTRPSQTVEEIEQ